MKTMHKFLAVVISAALAAVLLAVMWQIRKNIDKKG